MRGSRRYYSTRHPTDINQLESFVGKLNYYGQFLPAFASVCAPLSQLRCKDTPWKWSTECAVAFDRLKQMLADKTRLVHFDPEKPIVLATDTSSYGIGAVISHVLPDGSEEPIAFASNTLSKAERGYAQVEKEGLSIRYRSSAEHSNADALSRLPAGPYVAFDREEEVGAITYEVMQIATEVISQFSITSKLVGDCTKKDTLLSQVLNFVSNG